MVKGKAWTMEEYDQFAAYVGQGMTPEEMAPRMGRSVKALYVARSRLRKHMPVVAVKEVWRDDMWSQIEDAKLVKLWNTTNLTQSEIGERMGRSTDGVAARVQRLRKQGVPMVNRKVAGRGPWRGRLKVPEHVHPLVKRLFHEMNQQMTTCEELAQRIGMDRNSVSRWRHRHPPDLLNLDAAFTVLGYELTVRPIKERDEKAA